MGGKTRIVRHILPIMLKEAYDKGITTWVEPFVGGGNVIDKVPNTFTRIGIDYNPHTIAALIAIRDYADKLPESLSEEEYKKLMGMPPEPITSWLRFVASFAAIFEGSYGRDKEGTNYVERAKRMAQIQSPNLQGVRLIHGSYDEFSNLENCLIYCDPPYEGTTPYKGTGKFDHKKFWAWCREMSKKNSLFVSEYKAPDDFVCVWSGEIKLNFKGVIRPVIEKLFIYSKQ